MSERTECARIFLMTPPVADAAAFAPLLEAAVAGGDIACLLLRTEARDDGDAKAIIRALAPIAQRRDVAVLIEGDTRLAARADADGVHIVGAGSDLADALSALRPDRIVGCGILTSRDAAMAAGEAGVDYLMFGAPGQTDHADVLEWVSWWSSIFNVPCVGYASSPDVAGDIARAGAEFVGLCEGLWDEPATITATVSGVLKAISLEGMVA